MKLAVAIASSNALPSAFVVFRGIEDSIKKAAQLGYDGIELALKNINEINVNKLQLLLKQFNLQVSCISTGQLYAETGLMFTESDYNKRILLKNIFKEIIDLASDFGQLVNVGRVRGMIDNEGNQSAENCFIDMIYELCDYAKIRGVKILIEPVNRYEINFINSIKDGVDLLNRLNICNLRLMADVFHMNIEDVQIGNELAKYINYIDYIHLADSNRLAPGWGHTDFMDIFHNLNMVGYTGWLSVEILPKPDPFVAARQAINYIKQYLS